MSKREFEGAVSPQERKEKALLPDAGRVEQIKSAWGRRIENTLDKIALLKKEKLKDAAYILDKKETERLRNDSRNFDDSRWPLGSSGLDFIPGVQHEGIATTHRGIQRPEEAVIVAEHNERYYRKQAEETHYKNTLMNAFYKDVADTEKRVAKGEIIGRKDERWNIEKAHPVSAVIKADGIEFVITGTDAQYQEASSPVRQYDYPYIKANLIDFRPLPPEKEPRDSITMDALKEFADPARYFRAFETRGGRLGLHEYWDVIVYTPSGKELRVPVSSWRNMQVPRPGESAYRYSDEYAENLLAKTMGIEYRVPDELKSKLGQFELQAAYRGGLREEIGKWIDAQVGKKTTLQANDQEADIVYFDNNTNSHFKPNFV